MNIGSEQLYVTAADGRQATVVRGVNGSRAASHEAGAAVAVYRYPGPVVEACLQLAAEMWQGRNGLEVLADRRQRRGPASGLGKEVEGLLYPPTRQAHYLTEKRGRQWDWLKPGTS